MRYSASSYPRTELSFLLQRGKYHRLGELGIYCGRQGVEGFGMKKGYR
jgi:hypothetical protein